MTEIPELMEKQLARAIPARLVVTSERQHISWLCDNLGTADIARRRIQDMKRFLLAVVLVLLMSTSLLAAVKTYQVTGPVLEVRRDAIVVQKGSDKWEIAKDAATKITGELKVGSKVTIEYRMTATAVTAKSEAPAKKK